MTAVKKKEHLSAPGDLCDDERIDASMPLAEAMEFLQRINLDDYYLVRVHEHGGV